MSAPIYFGRICWNTVYWRHPSGEPKGERKSHAAKHGFGYDEWLGRSEWVLGDGFRYGFLQTYSQKKAGFSASEIQLFTIEPTRQKRRRFLVGRLSNCEKLSTQQAQFAFSEFIRLGWFRTMQGEVSAMFPREKITSKPINIINVRFRPRDLHWFSSPQLAKPNSRVHAIDRYKLCT